jgi:hypothetical protein
MGMVTWVDPTPTAGEDARDILIFADQSMVSTRLYHPGGDPETDPAYTVSTSLDDHHLVRLLRHGAPVATVVLADGLKKSASGRLGTVALVGRGEVPIEQWIDFDKKGDVKATVAGETYVWTERKDGGCEVGFCDRLACQRCVC